MSITDVNLDEFYRSAISEQLAEMLLIISIIKKLTIFNLKCKVSRMPKVRQNAGYQYNLHLKLKFKH